MKQFIVGCLFFFSFGQILAAKEMINQEGATVFELNARGGLPNFFCKALHGDSIRVAYLGGSITAQEGWRVLSLEWFNQRFPKAGFSAINAAIGGTGSNFGVFRLNDHVLKFKPDLVFVEFAVNDSKTPAEKITRSMEGIVRQIWKQNPLTDICFIYTIVDEDIETEKNGKLPASVETMETIADKYQIPSINFGCEVVRMVNNKQLIMIAPEKELNGVMVFSSDGIHPYSETGHIIYNSILKRSFEKLIPDHKSLFKRHKMSKPIAKDYFANTQMIDLSEATLSKNWQIIQIDDQPSFNFAGKYLNIIGKASRTGETLGIRFKGRAIGAYDIMGPDAGRVIVEIDGIIRDTVSRFDRFCTYRRMNSFLIDHLENKEHQVVFRVLSDPFDKAAIVKEKVGDRDDFRENNWFVGKILIDGKLMK